MFANVSDAVLYRMMVRVLFVFILLVLAAPTANNFAQTGSSEISLLGMKLSEMTDELRRKYRIAPGISGIVITSVDPGRNAAVEFGGEFDAGEVITTASVYLAGLRQLSRPEDLLSLIEQSRRESRSSVRLLVANSEGRETWRDLPIANYEPSKVVKKNAEQQIAESAQKASPRPVTGWFDTNKPNCKVWNSVPQMTESATWSGGCSGGRANGQGHLVWRYVEDGLPSSEAYEGQLKDGRLHGRGVFKYADGDRYEGEFKDGARHGRGVFTYADGDRYEGLWEDGERHGRGVYTYADGDRVEGGFKDGEATGRAKFTRRRGPTEIIYFRNGCGVTRKYRICLK